MSDSSRTSGEVLLEKYLNSQEIPFEFEKEHAGKSKRPDYTLKWYGKTILLRRERLRPDRRSFRLASGSSTHTLAFARKSTKAGTSSKSTRNFLVF